MWTWLGVCSVNVVVVVVVIGVCLLLAAKFFMDMKKPEIKDLLLVSTNRTVLFSANPSRVDSIPAPAYHVQCGIIKCVYLPQGIADTFRVSAEELVSYELPVLAALHFSLLTPIYQTLTHFERLKDR